MPSVPVAGAKCVIYYKLQELSKFFSILYTLKAYFRFRKNKSNDVYEFTLTYVDGVLVEDITDEYGKQTL